MPLASRRGFLLGLGAAVAAPAVIRMAGLLMPVRPLKLVRLDPIGYGAWLPR